MTQTGEQIDETRAAASTAANDAQVALVDAEGALELAEAAVREAATAGQPDAMLTARRHVLMAVAAVEDAREAYLRLAVQAAQAEEQYRVRTLQDATHQHSATREVLRRATDAEAKARSAKDAEVFARSAAESSARNLYHQLQQHLSAAQRRRSTLAESLLSDTTLAGV